MADGSAGLLVVDITNTGSPRVIGQVGTPSGARGVVVTGALAFVADIFFGLQVVGNSEPTSPQVIGSVNTPGYAFGIDVRGSIAYVVG